MEPLLSPGYVQLDAELRSAEALSGAQRLAALQALEPHYPRSGRLQQALAQTHLTLGQESQALSAYRRAVQRNDALAESWTGLARLCRGRGELSEAEEAARCAFRLTQLPAQVVSASSLLNEGELGAAEQTVRDYLQRHGAHVDAMRILAQISIRLNVLDDAEILLENVVAMRPEYAAARFEYASVLAQRRRYELALPQILQLLRQDSRNPLYRKLHALICDGLGRADEALQIYAGLLQERPRDTELAVSMAQILRTRGAGDEAVRLLQPALRAPASRGAVALALSNIRTYRFDDEEIAQLRHAAAAEATSLADRYQLCFALGKALEERAQYEESFAYYARGNALKRSEIKVNPEILIQTMRRQPLVCTREFFAARRGLGCQRADPIFIVGMPRAGSTLLEQILASHSQVDGTQELPDIPRLVHQFRDRDPAAPHRYPAVLAELTAEQLRRLGEEYLEDTHVHRKGAPFFIDKLPNNFRDIGFIQLILPNAHIIDARRGAMACCFGNFKQLFAYGMEFKYSFPELARYYCHYVALMEHWDAVLPGKVLRVHYEDVVEDLEASVRRMLEFLGLPFESACLKFHETTRPVRTVSSDQVRRPISREGLTQWRHFEPWLGPLQEALRREAGALGLMGPRHAGAHVSID
ncbi:MAG TPA: sulfotransferase [Steroidobacteraceae bacterium]|nr:sulfotransferase [Steroidobacteraceae bacterium]